MYMIEPDLTNIIERLKPLYFVQNIPFKYHLHLWQVINISNRLFHSFRGKMLDDYLGNTKNNGTKNHEHQQCMNQFGNVSYHIAELLLYVNIFSKLM